MHLSGINRPDGIHARVAGNEERCQTRQRARQAQDPRREAQGKRGAFAWWFGRANGKPGLVFGEARTQHLINVGHAVLVMCAGYRVKVFLG